MIQPGQQFFTLRLQFAAVAILRSQAQLKPDALFAFNPAGKQATVRTAMPPPP